MIIFQDDRPQSMHGVIFFVGFLIHNNILNVQTVFLSQRTVDGSSISHYRGYFF
jgi:hypothetical protein